MNKTRRSLVFLSVGATITALLAACAPTVSTSATDTSAPSGGGEVVTYNSVKEAQEGYPVADLCGDEPLTIAHVIGYAVPYFTQMNAMLEKDMKACPNVKLSFANANGSPETAASTFSSLVAQGVNGIVAEPIFGPTQVPSFRAAYQAGVPIVTYIDAAGAIPGQDVTANIDSGTPAVATEMATWMNQALDGKGTVAFIGGTAGQPSSERFMVNLSEEMKKYPGITFVTDTFTVGGNDPGIVRQATAGLLAQHGRIDGIFTDYGAVSGTVYDAYEAAGFAPPALAVGASTNGLNCKATEEGTPFMSTDGGQVSAVLALRAVLAQINQVADYPTTVLRPSVSVDTLNGIEPKCDPAVSPDADWTSTLTDDEVAELFSLG